jgi:hypothetical protein
VRIGQLSLNDHTELRMVLYLLVAHLDVSGFKKVCNQAFLSGSLISTPFVSCSAFRS